MNFGKYRNDTFDLMLAKAEGIEVGPERNAARSNRTGDGRPGETNKSYMDAARLLRLPTFRIIFRHLLPNSIAPPVTLIPIEVGHAVALEATLSFLRWNRV